MATPTAVRRLVQPCESRLRNKRLLPMSTAKLNTAPSRRPNRLECARCYSTTPRAGRFTYSVAASYIGKDRPFDPSTHVFHFDAYNRAQQARQRKSKASRPDSGQDSFFVSRLGPAGVALGVADGVGGWMDSGVDPADFSHGLCSYAAAEAHGYTAALAAGSPAAPPPNARQIMQRAYDAVRSDPAIPAGGSTAVIGVLDERGTLEVANLGDSGFIHLRLNRVHGYSEPQTHDFNTPFQLSMVPRSMVLRMAAFGGAQLCDLPRDAEVSRHALRHGDVLIFASDGLWDNLYNQEILRAVSRTMTGTGVWASSPAGIAVVPDLGPYTLLPAGEAAPAGSPVTLQSMLATSLVGAAKAASVNTKVDGPFAKEVKKYYPAENWRGGKVDDICVVTVVVSETEEPPAKPRL